MNKLLAALMCTIGLTGCGEKIVYLDSESGMPVIPKRVVEHETIDTVCLGNVLYYREDLMKQAALAPVLVPSSHVSVRDEYALKSVQVAQGQSASSTRHLNENEVTYVNLVGVICP